MTKIRWLVLAEVPAEPSDPDTFIIQLTKNSPKQEGLMCELDLE